MNAATEWAPLDPAPVIDRNAGACSADVWQRLAQAPHEYDLYHLLRWLDARMEHRTPLGRAARPAEEPLRLGQEPSLAFAPSTLAGIERGAGSVPRLSVFSFGLFGPNGPLPLHLTEYARDRARHHNDPAMSRFADLFHHRLLLLFYRAWADAQATTSLDRGLRGGARFGDYVASLIHLGQPGLRERDRVPDHAKLFMAGHLSRQTRNPEGLQQILATYFGLPVRIREWVETWVAVPPSRRTRLCGRGAGQPLGRGAVLGAAVLDVQSTFEIVIGPLSLSEYRRWHPDADSVREMLQWVRNYVGLEFAWRVRPVLARDQVPSARLDGGARLGWDAWLGERRSDRDADDLTYSPEQRLTVDLAAAAASLDPS
ncbi:type VI secretion system baseplate subunit TssG [Lysobacter firmicutimachus]|uniref:Type VI secretion system baseplate subunit TssG n=1 Tax=Lysobacter firmicutimachus TaxID=1792846 RepID=A0AAU8MSN6_9GAMM